MGRLCFRFSKGIRAFSSILFGALIIFSLILPASFQERPELTKLLQNEVSVVLKLVHVYVTDKKGNPVTDLAMSDFVIRDNGRPVRVTDFERHVLQPATDAKPEIEDQPKEQTDLIATSVPTVHQTGRKFFFFVDFAFNNARGILKAKTAALHFLESQVRPDDELGLLSYSMFKGVTVHEYLTRDHAKIREAIEAIGSKDIAGRASEIEQQYWLQVELPLTGGRQSGTAGGLTPQEQAAVSNLEAQRAEGKRIAQNFILRMTSLAMSLRYVPGQKHFLFFSTGVPSSMVYGNQAGNPTTSSVNSFANRAKFDPGDRVLQREVGEMQKEFSASGCVFYAFDTRESAKISDLFAYDRQTMETGARDFASKEGVFQDAQSVFRNDKTTGLDSLKTLSVSTGGKYYSNINMYQKNLDQVQNLTGTYYVLGYPINERWDGKYHEVKVEVTRSGCEVRAQAGYFNPRPFSEYTDLEKQLHLFDLALNERAFSRMPVNVPMLALMLTAEGITRLEVLTKVPGDITTRFSGRRVEFVTIFFNGKGEISDLVREEVDPASLRGHDMAFAASTTLRPGNYSCRLVIRDMDTGLSAVASAKATVVKPKITGVQMGTPLVLEAQAGGSFLSANSRKTRDAVPWTDYYRYDTALLSPVLSEVSAITTAIYVVIPCSISGGGQPDFILSANLVNSASGESSPISILRMDRVQRGPLESLTLELPTTSIAPGTYFLHFFARDKVSGSLGHTFTTLTFPRR
jgi:VWFA-related protein